MRFFSVKSLYIAQKVKVESCIWNKSRKWNTFAADRVRGIPYAEISINWYTSNPPRVDWFSHLVTKDKQNPGYQI